MSDHPVKRRKKLIEVAIPLEAINAASAREKSIRHGHPSTLHLWWARRPLAAARAVIFCQMVDDPSAVPEEFPTEEAQENERLRLFALISELVTWENTTNEAVLDRAREEIRRSWRRCCADNTDHPEAAELFNPEQLPGFHDPFAGGGALPLEAQRLGLEAYASDLNPVAVLINKAMIEIPPKFAGIPPVNPEARSKKQLIERQWKGAEGLAEDVRYYGKWMRDEAEKRIGHLYPKVLITPEMVNDPENPRPDLKPYEGRELTVIAWLWARTVESPNPAFSQVEVPLASTFMLSTKAGKEAYVEPIIAGNDYHFEVRAGKPADPEKTRKGTKSGGSHSQFLCLMSGSPMPFEYLRNEARQRRMGQRLMAVVAEGLRGRIYLSPTGSMESIARSATPSWKPELEICHWPGRTNVVEYGLTSFCDLFTPRQLVALSTFSELVHEAEEMASRDAINAQKESTRITDFNAQAYAKAISTYLGFLVDQQSNQSSTVCGWNNINQQMIVTYSRQAIPMVWDYAECNVLSESTGSFLNLLERQVKGITGVCADQFKGFASQADARKQSISQQKIVSTDPPYYDNIEYADLSDFFYAWLRRSLGRIYPEQLRTMATPKAEELVANPYRHGSKKNAEEFFLEGMTDAMARLAEQSHPAFPTTIYYAFKQTEAKAGAHGGATGWETFLQAAICAGYAITGTWPIKTESANKLKAQMAALASSLVLVCRKRSSESKVITRAELRRRLRSNLPRSLKELEVSNIAPVDLAQAVIGPGMAIFSSAKAVLHSDDSPMSVREALIEINAALDEYLSQDDGDLDSDSRFALTFFESFGYSERDFGDAEGLAKARNISVEGVAKAGILRSVAGKAQLLRREQLDDAWDPSQDERLCVWEATQHLIKQLETDGEGGASALLLQLKNLPGQADLAANCRALAYRLYNHCEKAKQAEEARAYNGLVIAWPELERLAAAQSAETVVQATLI